MNKTAVRAAQLAECILLHASARTTVSSSQLRENNKNFILLT